MSIKNVYLGNSQVTLKELEKMMADLQNVH